MKIFGTTGPEYDRDRRNRKDAKARGEKIRRHRPSKRDLAAMLAQAAKSGSRRLVDPVTGRILDMKAVQKVSVYKQRIRDSRCPECGKGMPRKGYVCDKCTRGGAGIPSEHEIRAWQDSLSLYDEQGRNKNGIRYDENGRRIW